MNPETPSNSNHTGSTGPIIGNCLRCEGMVRVPAKTTPKAEVRCPHCGHTFELLEILEQLVPELEVVESETDIERPMIDTEIKTENGKFVVPSQLANGARRRHRRSKSVRKHDSNSNSDAAPLDEAKLANVTEPESEVVITPASPKPPSARESRTNERRDRNRSRSRHRGKGKAATGSPVAEAFKVVLGAMMAIPIAYMLVFWVFRVDPLDLGPSLSKSVPFLVPAEFRGAPTIENESDPKTDDAEPQDNIKEPRVIDPDSPGGGLAIPMVDPELIGRN